MKLIAQFDPLLSSHLQHSKHVPSSVSYLSPRIQNEFISLLASTVRKQILCDIRRNKYYGLMLDSTPDLAHREQLSEVIRFVDVNFKTKKVTIKESFLGFIQLHAKDAATLENVIVEQMQADNLPISDCRSQCYDNAAVMAGELSGLQQRIAIRNPQASFVNCNNHSLNLAGLHDAKQDPVVVTFFGTVKKIYVFFSASTVRWEKMKELLGITLKRECPTRWSARQDAVNAIHEQFDGFLQLLENLYEDGTQTSETQNDAYSLLQNVMNFNFITLLDFWHAVLSKIDRIQKTTARSINEFPCRSTGLQQRLSSIREDVCITAVNAAKVLCEKLGIRIEGRIKRRKQMPGENAGDAGFAAVEEITRIMKSVIDRLIQEMTTRFGCLKTLDEKFGFLFSISKLFANDTSNDIQQHCATLADFYKTDIDGTELFVEISDCRMLLKTRPDATPSSPLELLSFIISYGNDIFPNLQIALQIMLTISVSVASCERSFSKLKIILTYLRASMGQERLSDLALLSIEKELVETINVDDVIDNFASARSRKVVL
ncbi:zinc finger MYM-type protein 1-like [Biomphalaria glabrata]|uniref:Zinc finger MYM-type protein 1-like n=1 Tax=Biomphalaria glabrata TaxID=6526 RepID=A0A9W2ZQ60_BIOGL|nr:zinc finger MYM-type protein 1-like [Biomphalaria glabrata]